MFNTSFVHISSHSLVLFLFLACNKILLDSCFTRVVFLFFFSWFRFGIKHAIIFILVRKSCKLGCFHACDNIVGITQWHALPNPIIDMAYSYECFRSIVSVGILQGLQLRKYKTFLHMVCKIYAYHLHNV
jgi:hypothetical protein